MSRAPDAVLAELMALLPPGWAWPRDAGSRLGRLLLPLAERLAAFEAGAEALMAETDPRAAGRLLGDYERVLGPDPCGRDRIDLSTDERRRIAHQRWTARGGQSPGYYKSLAAAMGVAIEIEEFWPFEAGFGEAGDELGQDPEQFVWVVRLAAARIVEFEAGASEAGDPLGEIVPGLAECILRRHAPAHTAIVFSYTGPDHGPD